MLLAFLLLFQTESTGSIEGTVINRATGAGVRRATVYLNGVTGGATQTNVVTDGSGRFAVRNLRPGVYRLSAQHPAFPATADSVAAIPSADVTLAAGETQRDVTLKLSPSGAVEGKAMDPDGDPMPNCAVRAHRFTFVPEVTGPGTRRLVVSGHGTTNDLGEYRLFDLPPGKYFFSAKCDTRHMSSDGDEAEVWLEQFYPGAPSPEGATRTDVPPGADLRAIDFKMRRGRAFNVRGRVVLQAVLKPQGFHGLLSRTDSGLDQAEQHGVGIAPDGTFQITGVTPGSYRLVIRSFDSGSTTYFGEAQVIVGDRPPKPVTVEVRLQPDITGTVEYDGPAEQRRQIRVWLQPASNDGCSGGSSAEVSAEGTFALKSVTPGECVVMVAAAGGFLKSVTFAGAPAANDKIRIPPGSGGPLRVVVSSKAGTLEGSVTGLRPGAQAYAAVVGRQHHVVNLDAGGAFQLSNLAPGDYRVFAFQGMPVPRHLLGHLEGRGKSVRIEEGGRATVQLEAIGAKEAAEILEKVE